MTLLDQAAADPHTPAVDDLTRTRTRGELVDRGLRLGHWMLDVGGLVPGGHVAMLIGNRVELIDPVDFEEHLPRHPTGKLYTRLLRDKYWADRAGSV